MIEKWKPLLETCAYNILGSREEARDIVQDVLIRLLDRPIDHIDNKKAYLVRAVINRAINAKTRQELARKNYRGSWLPEPVMTASADHHLLQKDILNYSVMVLLEKLTASERAVFILREAFDYTHNEIAEALEISTDSSRQLLRRAKSSLKSPAAKKERARTAFRPDQFLSVIQNREVDKLEALLSEDIVITSDGGGKVLANRIPVTGKPKAVKYLLGVYEKYQKNNQVIPAVINHQPALLHFEGSKLVSCQIFHANEGVVQAIYFVRNPDKLKNLSHISGLTCLTGND
ncbi:RNA polymerase sigma-70 factor (ECF subfamily) [Anseongella ginsenosidimutans]|uniref:RNA polymerase sigma-70 factor (ECF subfamily) n=1 Tax=Anseongella ginsenosidimutans TaxID=496056 RepID=A0A4R3KUP5_9SPHI|nr:sigma-70 family RNA polymerase sigma factor [Anseongella ginsenosidimutans]QEC51778.1 sigma-70 family RNA polymerase sigma factor [Anseongella ginsenosidimutans]TCS89147.1 RNA polymerase sigma-70 factor (ECF subfamily) [Anseongella ginsenosidimutans]